MPALQAVYREATGAQSFELLAINLQEIPEMVRQFGAELSLSFPLVVDRDGQLADAYQVRVLPTTYIIDAAGVVRFRHLGPLDPQTLRDYLAQLS